MRIRLGQFTLHVRRQCGVVCQFGLHQIGTGFDSFVAVDKRRIDVHDWNDDAWTRGAAGLVVQQFFNFDVPPGASPIRAADAEPEPSRETLELSYRPL